MTIAGNLDFAHIANSRRLPLKKHNRS